MHHAIKKTFFEHYDSIIGSILVSMVALSIAIWGSVMKSWVVKPRLKVTDLKKYKQNQINVWRLLIKNIGSDIAKDVKAEISMLFDNGKLRKNYLPAPLRWTHSQYVVGNHKFYRENKDIHPGQTAHLDIFDEIPIKEGIKIRIATTISLDNIPDFSSLQQGKAEIKMKIFEKNTKPISVSIAAELKGRIFEAHLNEA